MKTTKGTTEAVNANYELMERGGYIPTGYKFDPVVLNARLPLEFFEARNALRIAQSEGAEQYASDSYGHAVQLMNNADEYAVSKHIETKPLIAVSREAVQTAEDCACDRGQETRRDTTGAMSARIQRMCRRNRRNRLTSRSDLKEQAQADTAERSRREDPGRIRCRQGTRRRCRCTIGDRTGQIRHG